MQSGNAQAQSDCEGHEQLPHLPADFLLAFGGDRAVRRRVRDRELALDHDRAAHARVRHAAHARRVAAAGARLGHRRGARDRRARLGRRPRSSGSALGKGLFKLFDAVGFTLPNNGLTVRDPHDRRRARSSASSSRCSRASARRSAPRACRRSRRCARARRCREGALPPLPRRRRRGDRRCSGFAALLYGLFGSGLDTKQVLILIGLGAVLIFIGVALFSRPPRRAARPRARLARDADRRRGRRARARQLAAQPAAHRLDRGRADDRPRARDARRDARGGHHRHLQQLRGRPRPRRFYAITAQNNFSPIPISAAQAAAKAPGVGVGRERPRRRDLGLRQHADPHGRRPGDRQGDQPRLEAGLAVRPRRASAQDGAFVDDGLRQEPRPQGRLAARSC